MPNELKTVRELIQVTAAYLEGKGIDASRLNAERLLGDVLGLSRLELYLHHDRPLDRQELDRFRDLVRRRAAGEPLQTRIGEAEFFSRPFKVEPGVFIPRPETELLVERCVELLTGGTSRLIAPIALEIGCGSGVIAVSLAAEIPPLRVWATDADPQAVRLTELNARRLGVGPRLTCLEGNLAEPVPAHLAGKVDLLVSNPPYVRRGEIDGLAVEVARHDPRVALDGGPDGLTFYHALAALAPRWMRPGGWVALEIGHDQADDVGEILRRGGNVEIAVRADYNGLPRVVTARRPEAGPGAGDGEQGG
jgi:release factor glutamine methyltransferase